MMVDPVHRPNTYIPGRPKHISHDGSKCSITTIFIKEERHSDEEKQDCSYDAADVAGGRKSTCEYDKEEREHPLPAYKESKSDVLNEDASLDCDMYRSLKLEWGKSSGQTLSGSNLSSKLHKDSTEPREGNITKQDQSTLHNSNCNATETKTSSLQIRNLKKHKCAQCGKYFTRAEHLKTHILTHSGIKPYRCMKCNKYFSQSSNLKVHLLTHSNVPSNAIKKHKCAECDKCFALSCNLKTHLLTHSGERPYTCKYCDKCFTQSGHLKTHLLTHSGLKPHKCSKCGKGFYQSGHLKAHLIIHSGTRPFKCTVCEKSFSDSSTLKKHILTHPGTKPHLCEECGKCFAQSGHLKRHWLTHSGAKPHKCRECGKCFTRTGTLNKHLLGHAVTKPNKCLKCGKHISAQLKSHFLIQNDSELHTCIDCSERFSQSHVSTHFVPHMTPLQNNTLI